METTLSVNQSFKDWVNHLKQDIRSAQIKAAVRVNSELLHLYWQLGAEIVDMKGFSYRNIRSIKQWYLFYNERNTIWQQAVAKLGEDRFFSVPWGHHLYIISQCKEVDKALFYPTIGLLIYKTKNEVMAQYALESTNQPIGISEYELSKLMPENIKSQLPSIEEIEEQVKRIQGKEEEEV